MNKIKYLLPLLLLALYLNSTAQIMSSANFIKSGKRDAVKLISAYLLPTEQAVAFNSANSNMLLFRRSDDDKLHFGFGINLTTSFVNPNDLSFDINALNLEEVEAADPNKSIAQTMSGNDETIVLRTKDEYYKTTLNYPFYEKKPILSLDSPKGLGLTFMPYTLIHLFLEKSGNLLNFKILPQIKLFDRKLGVFNIGVYAQHNLETSLKFLAKFPIDIYISGGFTYNRVIYYLDIKPNEEGLTFSSPINNSSYENQEIQAHSKSIPIRLILVKPLKNFSLFLSGGYNILNSLVKMVGNYPVYTSDPTDQFSIVATDIKDPFEYSRNFNKLSASAGASYRSTHFTIGLKYTYSYYKNIDFSIAYTL